MQDYKPQPPPEPINQNQATADSYPPEYNEPVVVQNSFYWPSEDRIVVPCMDVKVSAGNMVCNGNQHGPGEIPRHTHFDQFITVKDIMDGTKWRVNVIELIANSLNSRE